MNKGFLRRSRTHVTTSFGKPYDLTMLTAILHTLQRLLRLIQFRRILSTSTRTNTAIRNIINAKSIITRRRIGAGTSLPHCNHRSSVAEGRGETHPRCILLTLKAKGKDRALLGQCGRPASGSCDLLGLAARVEDRIRACTKSWSA